MNLILSFVGEESSSQNKIRVPNIATHTDSQGRAALVLAKFGVELTLAESANPARRWWRHVGLRIVMNKVLFVVYIVVSIGVYGCRTGQETTVVEHGLSHDISEPGATSGESSRKEAKKSDSFNPFAGPKPLAVLIQKTMGSNTPLVVIYKDGLIVYKKRKIGEWTKLLSKQLTVEELDEVKKKLNAFGDYSKIKSSYILSPYITDRPETKIYLSIDNSEFVTGVYGLWVSDNKKRNSYRILTRDQEGDETLPRTIIELWEYLTSLEFADAKPWKPTYIEVMLWRYGYIPFGSIRWPKDWPGLESPQAIRRGDAYSIFLSAEKLPALLDLLNKKRAVYLDGKKWSASVRYAFPSEPVWLKAFRKAMEKENETQEIEKGDQK